MPEWLMATMEQPAAFGPWHLGFLAGIFIFGALLIIFARKCSDKIFRIIVAIAWLIIVILEVGKELVWGWSSGSWNYDWYSFPYQFCSLPFYIWPLVFLLPESKYRDAINIFVGTFVFFAGFAYLFVASSLCNYVFINIQTMVHHGLQAAIGLFVFVHEFNKFNIKKFFQSTFFLAVSVAVAALLNIAITGSGHGCNLFELNPIIPTESAVFGDILKATNYPTFFMIYIIGFTVFACVCYFAFKYLIVFNRFIGRKITECRSKKA